MGKRVVALQVHHVYKIHTHPLTRGRCGIVILYNNNNIIIIRVFILNN